LLLPSSLFYFCRFGGLQLYLSALNDSSVLMEAIISLDVDPFSFSPAAWTELKATEDSLLDLFSDILDINAKLVASNMTPRTVGWEPNELNKPAPKVANLKSFMDPERLMANAVDLNLRLMRWRMWQSLDLDKVRSQRCLLLGAGTLGCAVARTLIGWGIRTITFVDNGRVSYSNPSRQSLFEYTDAEKGEFKAVAAASSLKRIIPGIDSTGVVLTIPMPGHPIAPLEADAFHASYTQLMQLIQSHDAVFLLTDSREARWLPTVACASMDKMLINSALGFDSYLVMRHGSRAVPTDTSQEGILLSADADRPGCYFCTDVVAPTDSLRDRSLDQQCTVTRPGLAMIAGALATELMIATLNHPLEHRCGLPNNILAPTANSSAVINLPHQIRGRLEGFTQMSHMISAFAHCSACSVGVLAAFVAGGSAFVRRVCNDPNALDEVSGVLKMHQDITNLAKSGDVCDWDESDLSSEDGSA
jgi:ubiquitin-like modifier-activating enzyme ATG7